jgi:arginyl-tRNA synthetase
MIPGDIAAAAGVRAGGTWRPAPPGDGGGPGTYATSLPFLAASAEGGEPRQVAAALAARLRQAGWITAARVTGGGYLTVTVTPAALAALAVRVPAAGDACVASDALQGTVVAGPAAASLASAGCWDEARTLVSAAVTARLARAAGATVTPGNNTQRSSAPAVVRHSSQPGSPAAAAAAAGPEAVCYALARAAPVAALAADPLSWARNRLDNPFFMVRYAHARAASAVRWAADLGIDRGPAAGLQPELLASRCERDLLDAISWLPERAAGAARRGRAEVFVRHLESVASAWLDCSESCPALPFGGHAAPQDEPGTTARLWLAVAARTALAAGLRLLGIVPPQRL